MKSNKLLIILLIIPFISLAQDNEPIQNIRDELEEDVSFVQEEFDWLINHKITMNEFLNNSEIYSLYVNNIQYQNLREYYEINGELIDLLELQTVEGFTEKEYKVLSKIIRVRLANEIKAPSKIVLKTSITHKSEIEKNYLGNQAGLQQRLNIKVNNRIKIGLARENDIGEPYYNYKSYEAFDHHSMFINYKRNHVEIILGHFEVFYGQGLLIGQGFNNNLISDLSDISSLGSIYRGIANNNEYNRFRGAAVLLKGKYWQINLASSLIRRDEGSSAGYHRTLNEINKKRNIKDDMAIIEIARNTKRKQQSILIARNEKSLSFSTQHQIYFSNNKIFNSEIAFYDAKYAYFLGIMILISKNNSISFSRTFFSSNYNSPHMSQRVMGINRNDQEGFRIAYVQNLRKNYSIELLSIMKQKRNIIDKKEFGQFNNRYEIVLRRVKKEGNSFSINLTHLNKSNKINDVELNALNQSNQLVKIKHLLILDQKINVRYQIMVSRIINNYSWLQSLQINFKTKKFHLSNTICNYNASSKNIIYYHENSINGAFMSALNGDGMMNDISLLLNTIRGLKILVSVQNKYEYASKKNEQRLMLRVELRC